MNPAATILLGGFALYVVLGLAIALAFVVSGVTRVQGAPVTIGARILIFPGAAALWPLVLARWRQPGGVRWGGHTERCIARSGRSWRWPSGLAWRWRCSCGRRPTSPPPMFAPMHVKP